MKKLLFFLGAVCFAALSCTKEKTVYEGVTDPVTPDDNVFKEAANIRVGGYHISVEALHGAFYKGYNEIRVKIMDSANGEPDVAGVTLLPITIGADGRTGSCPHRYKLTHRPDSNYYSGYSVFTSESHADRTWALTIDFTVANQTRTATLPITVQAQPNQNRNMTAFTGKDDEQYIIALVAPLRPKVAENELVAGIYRRNTGGLSTVSYTEANGYTLLLDPRMPEPSMGNHSSPNNVDLTQQSDGLYHGVVNYTMTGNWTLNFIMLNEDGRIIKGTEVPTDFTPGIEGVKSELYIDVLF